MLGDRPPIIGDGQGIAGLDSTEKDNPPGKFQRLYAAARAGAGAADVLALRRS